MNEKKRNMELLLNSMSQTEMKFIQLKRKLIALNLAIESARLGEAGVEFTRELNEIEDSSLEYFNQPTSHHD